MTDTGLENWLLLVIAISVLCIVLAAGAWWADRKLDQTKPQLPKPQRRAVVGEDYKPWM